jgi:curli production assembly/transport component CsgG/holdfast attachment protein HfaB
MRFGIRAAALATSLALTACGQGVYPKNGVKPNFTFPVTSNETPYSRCLRSLASVPGTNLPTFSVGEVADKTGQLQSEVGTAYSTVLTQGASEMVMSALYKTDKVRLAERFDLRVPLAEMKMADQGLINRGKPLRGSIPGSDFVVVGAITELNYNIVSEGAQLAVSGIGAGARTVIINVGLDLRVVDTKTFEVKYVSSLQKQIYGYEVSANVFRFFGSRLVEFDAGRIQNEPLQLGVRSVIEMAVYQIMTDFLGMPSTPQCKLIIANPYDEQQPTHKES